MSCLKKNSSKVVYSLHLSTIIPTSQCFRDRERGFFFFNNQKAVGKTGPGLGGSGGEGTGSPLGCGVVISNPSRGCC